MSIMLLDVLASGFDSNPCARRKGLAILWVLLIHSRALGDSFVFVNVVNRAVPLFGIVFGLNSTLWWRSRAFPEPSVAHSSRGAGMRSSAAIPDR